MKTNVIHTITFIGVRELFHYQSLLLGAKQLQRKESNLFVILKFYLQILFNSASNGSKVKFHASSFLAATAWR